MKISVVINTLNEEKNLSDCLESVKWAGEIVVVDMHSEDKTQEIAEKYGAKVYLHKKMGYVEPARNFAISKATGDWILVIDADERVTEELKGEIEQTVREVRDDKGYDGYYLKRQDFFLGKWLKYGETANVKIVRLVKKGKGKWSGRIHEQWEVEGRLGEMENPLLHTRPDLRTFIHNLNTYTEARVEDLIKLDQQKPRWRLGLDIVLYPVAKFLQNYFWRKGFLDGEQGLILAMLMSFHSFLVRAKLFHATRSSTVTGPVASFPPASARRPPLADHSRHPSRTIANMKFLIFLLFLLFPLGQLGRWDFGNGIVLHLNDLVVGLVVAGWGIKKITTIKNINVIKIIKNDQLFKPILAVMMMMGISLVVNSQRLQGKEILAAGMYFVRWAVYAGLYFVMRDLRDLRVLWETKKWLILAGTAVAVLGILQYFFYPDLRLLTAQEWDPHYYRIVSTFLDPGFTGAILAVTLLLIVETRLIASLRTIFLFLLNYVALVLTYSRASYLMFLIAIWVWGWQKRVWRVPVFLSALLLATMLILPRPGGEGVKLEREASIWARINNWENSLKIIRDHPIFGVGFNAYRFAQRDYGFINQTDWQKTHSGGGADSSLLFIWATTGTVGLLAYLWLLKKMAVRAGPVVGAILVGLLVHSFFSNTLFYPWIMEIMWVMILF